MRAPLTSDFQSSSSSRSASHVQYVPAESYQRKTLICFSHLKSQPLSSSSESLGTVVNPMRDDLLRVHSERQNEERKVDLSDYSSVSQTADQSGFSDSIQIKAPKSFSEVSFCEDPIDLD